MNHINEKLKKVQIFIYDGTIESYNLMIERLYYDREKFYVGNVDENYNSTNKWTGIFIVFPSGIIYKPGDSYVIEVDESIPALDTFTQ